MEFLDLIAPSNPARPLLARVQFEIRPGAVPHDALIDLIGFAGMLARWRYDYFVHTLI
jgi:hypothetical protein